MTEASADWNTKTCKICAMEMPRAAIKCIRCGSYQDFRRFFEFGNSTLALLIALISVISLASSNVYNLYQSAFVDPLRPSVTARVMSIEPEHISVLYHNNGKSRVFLEAGSLCRVPILKSSVDVMSETSVRFPRPSEVSAVHMVVYSGPQGQMLEAGSSLIATYPLHQTRPEEGLPFDEKREDVRGYCFVQFVDQRGHSDGEFVLLDAFAAYMLQRDLVKRLPKE